MEVYASSAISSNSASRRNRQLWGRCHLAAIIGSLFTCQACHQKGAALPEPIPAICRTGPVAPRQIPLDSLTGSFRLLLTVTDGSHVGDGITTWLELWRDETAARHLVGRSGLARHPFPDAELDWDPSGGGASTPGVLQGPFAGVLSIVIGSSGFMDAVGVMLYPGEVDSLAVRGGWLLPYFDNAERKHKYSGGTFCAVRVDKSELP